MVETVKKDPEVGGIRIQMVEDNIRVSEELARVTEEKERERAEKERERAEKEKISEKLARVTQEKERETEELKRLRELLKQKNIRNDEAENDPNPDAPGEAGGTGGAD